MPGDSLARIAPVIGDQSYFFVSIQGSAEFDGNSSGFDQMLAESGNQTAMGARDLSGNRGFTGQQGRTGRIEHRVVGAIAGTIHISGFQKQPGRRQGTFGLVHQVRSIHKYTPSRSMLCSSRGFE